MTRPAADLRAPWWRAAALPVALVALVLIMPLPLGGNRAAVWLASTAVCGLLVSALALRLVHAGRCLQIAALGDVIGPVLLALAFGMIQTLPLAPYLPAGWLALPDIGAALPRTISLVPEASLTGLLRLAGAVAFLALMLEVATAPQIARRIGWALFAAVVIHAVLALIAGPSGDARGGLAGPFANPNSFATFLGMGAVLGLALLPARGRSHPSRSGAAMMRRAGLWLCLGLVLLALLGTDSRMGVFATILGLAVVVAGQPRRLVTALGLGALLLGVLALSAGVLDRAVFLAEAVATRAEVYRQTLGLIAARPLAGYGLDAFAPAFELVHRPPLASTRLWDNAHSSYLTLWVELGLIAGSLPMLAALAVARRLLRQMRGAGPDAALPRAALAALILAAVHALVDFSLEIHANLLMLLALIALGLSQPSPEKRVHYTI